MIGALCQNVGRCGEWWFSRRNRDSQMVKALTRTVFVGTFRHTVDDKNRVAIPAKWRAAARGSQEFYVLPDPKSCLVVLPASAMEKMLERVDDISIGEYKRRN